MCNYLFGLLDNEDGDFVSVLRMKLALDYGYVSTNGLSFLALILYRS